MPKHRGQMLWQLLPLGSRKTSLLSSLLYSGIGSGTAVDVASGAAAVGLKRSAKTTRIIPAPIAGTSHIDRQSCVMAPFAPVIAYASTTFPDTHDPIYNPTPSVTNAMKPCAAARIFSSAV